MNTCGFTQETWSQTYDKVTKRFVLFVACSTPIYNQLNSVYTVHMGWTSHGTGQDCSREWRFLNYRLTTANTIQMIGAFKLGRIFNVRTRLLNGSAIALKVLNGIRLRLFALYTRMNLKKQNHYSIKLLLWKTTSLYKLLKWKLRPVCKIFNLFFGRNNCHT